MMSYEEALELIERIPFIRTFQVTDNQILEEFIEEASQKKDYVEWIKVIKTCYIREHFMKKKPLNEKIKAMRNDINDQLNFALSKALDISINEVELFIKNYIEENDET